MKKIWERIVPLSKADRSFDIKFWQAQSAQMRFRATFDMLKDLYRLRSRKANARTFRLQRTIENLKQA
jgi:UDP-3-O-acyl-N-acetylglucosamine deacetylase